MILVKLFGMLRMEYEVSSIEISNCENVTEIISKTSELANIPHNVLENCNYFMNNKLVNHSDCIEPDSEVVVMLPVQGG